MRSFGKLDAAIMENFVKGLREDDLTARDSGGGGGGGGGGCDGGRDGGDTEAKDLKRERRAKLCYPYRFASREAERRWCTRAPCRAVDWSLGYPILLCNDDGEYIRHVSEDDPQEEKDYQTMGGEKQARNTGGREEAVDGSTAQLCTQIVSLYVGPIAATPPNSSFRALHGHGVWATANIASAALIGPYGGVVVEEEIFEAGDGGEVEASREGEEGGGTGGTGRGREGHGQGMKTKGGEQCSRMRECALTADDMRAKESHASHAYYLGSGAHAVVLDGSRGPGRNALTHINHSCAPNARLREVYVDGQWHVICEAISDISAGQGKFVSKGTEYENILTPI